VHNTKQADNGIYEDQLINFFVNMLDEEVNLGLRDNAKIALLKTEGGGRFHSVTV